MTTNVVRHCERGTSEAIQKTNLKIQKNKKNFDNLFNRIKITVQTKARLLL
jgi:hypothetical protein